MPAGEVAGWIRAKALLQRRVGPDGARMLASAGSTAEAVSRLAATPYGHTVRAGMDLPSAQRAVGSTLLWYLRILAGWQPPTQSSPIRALAAGFEVANTVDLLLSLQGTDRPAPFELGSLSTAWTKISTARSAAGVRSALGRSSWGDPGDTDPAGVQVFMDVGWAYRVWDEVPSAAPWARRALGLLAAHLEQHGDRSLVSARSRRQIDQVLGRGADPVVTPGTELGPAWIDWWHQVDRGAASMAAASRPGTGTTAGVVGLLAVDAWRVRAALAIAGTPGGADGREDLLGAVA